jgi:hypothetical protein
VVTVEVGMATWKAINSIQSTREPSIKARIDQAFRAELSQPHFGIGVRVKPTLPKVGSQSLPGLPKIQSSSSRVKTPRIGVFFIPLERS